MSECTTCRRQLRSGYTTDTYLRRGCDIEVTVTGIPARVCSACRESYVDLDTMAEVERLIAPLFSYACEPHRLPTPRVTIEFPAEQAVAA